MALREYAGSSMLKRLLLGLFLGFLVGLAVAAALTHGLGMTFTGGFGVLVGYIAAAVTGLLVGFVTGKPIWSANGKIEAGLKGFFGALFAAGALFALRKWLVVNIDLSFLSPSATGALGEIPYAALPPIAALLGGFFEADNSPGTDDDEPAQKKRIATGGASAAAEADELEDEPAAKRAGRR